MKKSKSLSVLLAAILLLIGCEKEKPPVDKEFTPDHWPIVKTLGATPLTNSTAKLTGTVNACGLEEYLIGCNIYPPARHPAGSGYKKASLKR